MHASSTATTSAPHHPVCHSHSSVSRPACTTSRTDADEHPCIDASSPQCCHCGWRGSHSPNCPFRRR
ncbi:hypothetical protein DENSPDRAFT_776601 [Dentipellis sp. KUC8613]|nr:hypothetical protein DENSPDRAFT_776601 [Dentipellis sp. KUC8613]